MFRALILAAALFLMGSPAVAAAPSSISLSSQPHFGDTVTFTVTGNGEFTGVGCWQTQGGNAIYLDYQPASNPTYTFSTYSLSTLPWDGQYAFCEAQVFNRQHNGTVKILDSYFFEVLP